MLAKQTGSARSIASDNMSVPFELLKALLVDWFVGIPQWQVS